MNAFEDVSCVFPQLVSVVCSTGTSVQRHMIAISRSLHVSLSRTSDSLLSAPIKFN